MRGARTIIGLLAASVGLAGGLAAGAAPASAAPGDMTDGFEVTYDLIPAGTPQALAAAPGGDVYVAGPSPDSQGAMSLSHATPAGLAGPGPTVVFDPTKRFLPTGMVRQGDGKLVVIGTVGQFRPLYGETTGTGVGMMRVSPDGTLDPTFDGDGRVLLSTTSGAEVRAGTITVGPSGRLVANALERTTSGDRLVVHAVGVGGKADKTFGTAGRRDALVAQRIGGFGGVSLTKTGAIVTGASTCAATCGSLDVVRLTGKGVPDLTFSGDGRASFPTRTLSQFAEVTVTGDGGVLVLADDIDPVRTGQAGVPLGTEVMARLRPDGTPNTTFAPGGVTRRTGVGATISAGVQPDGKVLLLSDYVSLSDDGGVDVHTSVLRRFNWNGKRDTTFGRAQSDPVGDPPNIFHTPLGNATVVIAGNQPSMQFEHGMEMGAGHVTVMTGYAAEFIGGFYAARYDL